MRFKIQDELKIMVHMKIGSICGLFQEVNKMKRGLAAKGWEDACESHWRLCYLKSSLTLEVGFNIRCADRNGRKETHWGSREHSPQGGAGHRLVFPWVLGGKSWLSFHRRGLS